MAGLSGGFATWGDASEVLTSVLEDRLYQIAGAAAVLSAVCYTLLFKSSQLLSPKLCRAYLRLKGDEQVDWNTRLPSTLHALVVSWLCIWALCYSGDFSNSSDAAYWHGPGGAAGSDAASGDAAGAGSATLPVVLRVSELSYAVIGVSGGYFTMDAALLAGHPALAAPEIVVHHALALLSLGVAAQVRLLHVYLLVVVLSELTTPFVNARWLLDKAGRRDSKLYTVNGLLLTLMWGVARVVLFAPLFVHMAVHWHVSAAAAPLHALVLLLGVPLLLGGLNLMWFAKIVRGAFKLMFPGNNCDGGEEEAAGGAPAGGKAGGGRRGALQIRASARRHGE